MIDPIVSDFYRHWMISLGRNIIYYSGLRNWRGYVFYYTLIFNVILLMVVIYFVFRDHPTDTKEEMILDDLE